MHVIGVRKANAQLELKLAMNVKAWDFVNKDMEKDEVANVFPPLPTLFFTGKVCCLAFQFPKTASGVCGNAALLVLEQDTIREHLKQSGPWDQKGCI